MRMRSPVTEVIDLMLTQAIEIYREMEPEAAREAIARDLPEQTGVLLIELLTKTTCNECGCLFEFVEVERENGHSYYFVPVCKCI